MERPTINVHNDQAESPKLYAVDTTFLICADSALHPPGKQDKDCDKAFQTLLTYLCNGRQFKYMRPGTDAITEFSILQLVVPDRRSEQNIIKLNLKGSADNYKYVAADFITYLKGDSIQDVAKWVAFQFDDDNLVKIFFDSGTDKQKEEMETARRYLRDSSAYREIESLWSCKGIGSLPLRGEHSSLAAKAFKNNKDEYTLTYAFFAFAKGLLYPLEVLDEWRNCVHWLREYPLEMAQRRLRDSTGPGIQNQVDASPSGLVFLWGRVLLWLGQNCKNPEKFRDNLPETVKKLKDQTRGAKLADILSLELGKSDRNKAQRNRKRRTEKFVLGALKETPCAAQLVDIEKHPDWARMMGDCLIGRTGEELLSLYVKPEWYDSDWILIKKPFRRERLLPCTDGTTMTPPVGEFPNQERGRKTGTVPRRSSNGIEERPRHLQSPGNPMRRSDMSASCGLFWIGVVVVAICAVGTVIGGTLIKNNWGCWSRVLQATDRSQTTTEVEEAPEKIDGQRGTIREVTIDPNTGRSDLYARSKARVDKTTDYLIKEKVNPWLFMQPGSKTTITLHDGRMYSYAGLEFSGSVRDLFWQSFIDPFLEDAVQQVLDEVGKECQSNRLDCYSPLDEAARLLESMVRTVYHAMADVDQRLRGKGYPKNVQKMDVQWQIDRMVEKVKGYLRAAKALYSGK